jgi:hypothetical protein
MDIEKLTKHQIVLLTLLVSFVTSIATGIVTVSLLDQAPSSVTRTINQIVEHTVERVVPAAAPAGTVTEKTVVIKDDDLAAQSIATVQKSIVRIVNEDAPEVLIARGVVVGGAGEVLTDRGALVASGARRFRAILHSGESVPLEVPRGYENEGPLAHMRVATSSLPAVPLAQVRNLRLGQSVIRIGGSGADTVGTGVIATLPSGGAGDTVAQVEASVTASTPGSLLITIFGEMVGLLTTDSLAASGGHYSVPLAPAAASN